MALTEEEVDALYGHIANLEYLVMRLLAVQGGLVPGIEITNILDHGSGAAELIEGLNLPEGQRVVMGERLNAVVLGSLDVADAWHGKGAYAQQEQDDESGASTDQ